MGQYFCECLMGSCNVGISSPDGYCFCVLVCLSLVNFGNQNCFTLDN